MWRSKIAFARGLKICRVKCRMLPKAACLLIGREEILDLPTQVTVARARIVEKRRANGGIAGAGLVKHAGDLTPPLGSHRLNLG